jgi:hypothetical protein
MPPQPFTTYVGTSTSRLGRKADAGSGREARTGRDQAWSSTRRADADVAGRRCSRGRRDAQSQLGEPAAHGLAGENDGVPRAFADVLRQLEPGEALTLNRPADGAVAIQGSASGTRMSMGGVGGVALTGFVNLERLGLIQLGAPIPQRYPHLQINAADVLRRLTLTPFGAGFGQADGGRAVGQTIGPAGWLHAT